MIQPQLTDLIEQTPFKTEKFAELRPPVFSIDLAKVRKILSSTRVRNYVDKLDNSATFERFKGTLYEELSDLVDDAVEIAFYRAVPQSLSEMRNEYDDDEESHEFDYKGCCDACTSWWWSHHELSDCIEENEEIGCPLHKNHTGLDCGWAADCGIHDVHSPKDCHDNCDNYHEHPEWHVTGSLVVNSKHKALYPDCKFFDEEKELVKAA